MSLPYLKPRVSFRYFNMYKVNRFLRDQWLNDVGHVVISQTRKTLVVENMCTQVMATQ